MQGARGVFALYCRQFSVFDLLRQRCKHGFHLRGRGAVKDIVRDLCIAPDHGFCRIVQHGPIPEQACVGRLGQQDFHTHMAIIAANPLYRGIHSVGWAFEKLQIDVVPANQRPCDPVTDVMFARVQQDAAEQGHVIAKRLGGIDGLDEIGDDRCSLWGVRLIKAYAVRR